MESLNNGIKGDGKKTAVPYAVRSKIIPNLGLEEVNQYSP
jgi:hypothetical protein